MNAYWCLALSSNDKAPSFPDPSWFKHVLCPRQPRPQDRDYSYICFQSPQSLKPGNYYGAVLQSPLSPTLGHVD